MAKTRLPVWLLRDHDQAKFLRQPSQPVEWSEILKPDFQTLIDEMLVTMRQANGIGLAGPQIGRSIRLAVIDGQANDRREPFILINPVIETISADQAALEEGCLSAPKVYGLVPRARRLTVVAVDRQGQTYRLEASELLARVIQHEVDHLNGRLFIDRATAITTGRLPA